MNYLDDELLDGLAARYVMGSMPRLARARFDRLKLQFDKVSERVHYWEQLLAPLNDCLEIDRQVADRSMTRTWPVVCRRLGFEPSEKPKTPFSWLTASDFYWRWLTAVSSGVTAVLCLVLLLTISRYDSEIVNLETQLQAQSSAISTDFDRVSIAVINNEENLPLWVIERVDNDIRIQATTAINRSQQFDYELWFVADNGMAPVSLGVVPQSGKLQQPCPDIFNTHGLSALAISREAPGGSQSGSPGQVLYSASMIAL